MGNRSHSSCVCARARVDCEMTCAGMGCHVSFHCPAGLSKVTFRNNLCAFMMFGRAAGQQPRADGHTAAADDECRSGDAGVTREKKCAYLCIEHYQLWVLVS